MRELPPTSMSGVPSAGRRRGVAALLALPIVAAAAPLAEALRLAQGAAAEVLPAGGHHSRVMLGDSVVKLMRAGVIDRRKFEALHATGGWAAPEVTQILNHPMRRPIVLTEANARLYVNLLWPLGLANRMAANRASPLNGPALATYASTGGWTLGREASGGSYFNAFPIVELSGHQEALVTRVAVNSFRPCCNNSTFFQDCNHGSALLGMLALGAFQGLGEDALYREALAFNAFWFPDQYRQLALFFKVVRGVDWPQVDPRLVLGAGFSSASGMRTNVIAPLEGRGLLPPQPGTDCRA